LRQQLKRLENCVRRDDGWFAMTEKKKADPKTLLKLYLSCGLCAIAFTTLMFDFPENEAYQGWGLGLVALFFAWLAKRKISKITLEKSE